MGEESGCNQFEPYSISSVSAHDDSQNSIHLWSVTIFFCIPSISFQSYERRCVCLTIHEDIEVIESRFLLYTRHRSEAEEAYAPNQLLLVVQNDHQSASQPIINSFLYWNQMLWDRNLEHGSNIRGVINQYMSTTNPSLNSQFLGSQFTHMSLEYVVINRHFRAVRKSFYHLEEILWFVENISIAMKCRIHQAPISIILVGKTWPVWAPVLSKLAMFAHGESCVFD